MIDIGENRLIGLCGEAGSGKTHCAGALAAAVEEQGEKAVIMSFATPIKHMLTELLFCGEISNNQAREYLFGARKNEPLDILQGRTPRQAMQTLGTEWGRMLVGANLWVDIAFKKADRLLNQGWVVIFDDVRMASESAAINDRGGIVIRVHNPALPDAGDEHISERLPPYRTTYENPYYG